MVFKISKISGKWYNENNIEVSLDTNTQSGKDVELWLLQGNEPDFFEGTPEEIAEANKQKVPESISRMHLKIELIKRGIESQEVEDTINAIPSEMFSEIDKKIAITKFNDAVSFDRYNADLQLVATLMGLTQEDLDEIFINGNLLR